MVFSWEIGPIPSAFLPPHEPVIVEFTLAVLLLIHRDHPVQHSEDLEGLSGGVSEGSQSIGIEGVEVGFIV